MFGSMYNSLHAGKDTVLSVWTRMAINYLINEYGEMLKLNLDSKNKNIEIEVMFEGEKEPLKVYIQKYAIMQEEKKHFVQIKSIQTSRTWLNTIASFYLEGKNIEIPSVYAKILKVLV